jgi:transcriptional regulator with XRE-family HTH domain
MGIGERLNIVRGGETKKAFAEKFGVHFNTYSSYESGDTVPDAKFIASICKEFSVSAEWLLFGEGPMYREECRAGEGSQDNPPNGIGLRDEGSGDKIRHGAMPGIDTETLAGVISGIEKTLAEQRKELPPETKAELIILLYEYFTETGSFSEEKIDRYLKLVS